MNLCKYKDIFGKVNTGVHSYRIFNIAIVDTVLTIIGAKIIADYFKVDFIKVTIILIILSVLIHKLFCVPTTLTKIFFRI